MSAPLSAPSNMICSGVPVIKFSDDFNSSSLDGGKWESYYNEQNRDLGFSTLDEYSQANGEAVFSIGEKNGRPSHSMLKSSQAVFGVGDYAEARYKIKNPTNTDRRDWHFAFWMQTFGVPSAYYEIDCMENFPNYASGPVRTKGSAAVWQGSGSGSLTNDSKKQGDSPVVDDDDYHVYGVQRLSDRVDFFVDGVLFHSVTESDWLQDHDMNIMLTVIFDDWYNQFDLPVTSDNGSVLIDYVQVWSCSSSANSKPEFLTGSNLASAKIGTPYTSAVVATDGDGDSLVYSSQNTPNGLSLSSAGDISWPSPIYGNHEFTVSVSDGINITNKAFRINVTSDSDMTTHNIEKNEPLLIRAGNDNVTSHSSSNGHTVSGVHQTVMTAPAGPGNWPSDPKAYALPFGVDVTAQNRHYYAISYEFTDTSDQVSIASRSYINHAYMDLDGSFSGQERVQLLSNHSAERNGYHTVDSICILPDGRLLITVGAHNTPLELLVSKHSYPSGSQLQLGDSNWTWLYGPTNPSEMAAWEVNGYIQNEWQTYEEKNKPPIKTYDVLKRDPYDDRYAYLALRSAGSPGNSFSDMAFGQKLIRINTSTLELEHLGGAYNGNWRGSGNKSHNFIAVEQGYTCSLGRVDFSPDWIYFYCTFRDGVAGGSHKYNRIVRQSRSSGAWQHFPSTAPATLPLTHSSPDIIPVNRGGVYGDEVVSNTNLSVNEDGVLFFASSIGNNNSWKIWDHDGRVAKDWHLAPNYSKASGALKNDFFGSNTGEVIYQQRSLTGSAPSEFTGVSGATAECNIFGTDIGGVYRSHTNEGGGDTWNLKHFIPKNYVLFMPPSDFTGVTSMNVTSGGRTTVHTINVGEVAPGNLAPYFTGTSTLPNGVSGQPYSSSITAEDAENDTLTFSLDSGSLPMPQGLTLNSDGTITGTPTSHGSNVFTASVSDGVNLPVVRQYSLNIESSAGNNPPLWVTTSPLPNGSVGNSYLLSVIAEDPEDDVIEYTLVSGNLPDGVSMSSADGAVLSGTPTSAGTYSFTLNASDGSSSSDRDFEITISPVQSNLSASFLASSISVSIPEFEDEVSATNALSIENAVGDVDIIWSVEPSNNSSFSVSSTGNPASIDMTFTAEGVFAVSAIVSDDNGSVVATQTILVDKKIVEPNLPPEGVINVGEINTLVGTWVQLSGFWSDPNGDTITHDGWTVYRNGVLAVDGYEIQGSESDNPQVLLRTPGVYTFSTNITDGQETVSVTSGELIVQQTGTNADGVRLMTYTVCYITEA